MLPNGIALEDDGPARAHGHVVHSVGERLALGAAAACRHLGVLGGRRDLRRRHANERPDDNREATRTAGTEEPHPTAVHAPGRCKDERMMRLDYKRVRTAASFPSLATPSPGRFSRLTSLDAFEDPA